MKFTILFLTFLWSVIGVFGDEPKPVLTAAPAPAPAPVPVTVPAPKPVPKPVPKPAPKPAPKPIPKPAPCVPPVPVYYKPGNFTMPPIPTFGSTAAGSATASGASGGKGSSTAAASSSSSSSGGGKGGAASASAASSSSSGGKGGTSSAAASSASSSSSGGKGGKGGSGAAASSAASSGAGGSSASASASAWSTANNSDEVDEVEAKMVYAPKRNEKFMPPSCGYVPPPCDPHTYYRRFDGSCTNLEYPAWGIPNATYSRLLPPRYGDGLRTPRRTLDNTPLPSARKIRVELFPTGEKENTLWNINAMFWGQFMAHDMSLLKEPEHKFECCTWDGKYVSKRGRFCYPVKIPDDDPTMGKAGLKCMNFTRTVTDRDMGCGNRNSPAKQINAVTDYLDLSNVYGLNTEMANGLRSFSGGKLAVEVRNNHIYAPKETNTKDFCRCNLANEGICYKTGDSRSNQNPQLAILQILFVREHNRIADQLAALNPHWNDERLFQEARRILIAAYQRISYYEWLPIFLGARNLLDSKVIYENTTFINDYNSTISPSVSNEHAHSAFRFFHTHIMGTIQLMNPNRETVQKISLSDHFNRPYVVEQAKNVEMLTMGMIMQNLEETDNIFVKEITDKAFACGNEFGIDVRAADIQRDRDHALGYYNEYRKYCGLKEAKSFEDYGDLIPAESIVLLKKLYKNYTDVDLTVGGSMEALAPGAQCGPTFLCIMNEQFLRSRRADRFWFENKSSGFTEEQLAEIRKATVSAMFCDSGDGVTSIQNIGFTLIFPGFNEIRPCSEIVRMNLTKWQETPPVKEPPCKLP